MNTVKPDVYRLESDNSILKYKTMKTHCNTGNYCTLDKD